MTIYFDEELDEEQPDGGAQDDDANTQRRHVQHYGQMGTMMELLKKKSGADHPYSVLTEEESWRPDP